MARGTTYGSPWYHSLFWLPREFDIKELGIYGQKAIQQAGGVVIDQLKKFRVGLTVKKKPVSYHCPTCHLLIIAYQEFPP